MSEVRARSAHRTFLAVAIVASVIGIASARSAFAQDQGGTPGDDEQVVLTGELLVPEGATVGTAVIFDGDATIDGTAAGSVVAFNGDVEVTGTVRDDVVAFNGRVIVRSGAEVGGDIASRHAAQIEDGATVGGEIKGISGRFDLEGLGWVARYVWWFGYTISTLVLGLVLLLFLPGADGPLAEAFRRRTGASFGFGAAIFFLLPLAAVLLLVVVVAIPLGVFLLLALPLLYTFGYVAGAHVLGRRLVKQPGSRYVAFLVGWLILRGIGLIPFLGGLVWVVATIAGLGALVIAARGSTSVPAPAPALPAAPLPEPPPAV
ncbi:MAG TPA: polymer-forming cytoskeletal protein [Actinomycetota bacterium]|nr:polymer-forming cytoskeletal protein [Actinomycetota bacterium]